MKTNTIQAFNPALSLLILEGVYAKQGDLLRMTFFDLLHRNILDVSKKPYEVRKGGDIRTMHYVSLTDFGRHYTPERHEAPFFKLFTSSYYLTFLFQHVIKVARQRAGTTSQYRDKIFLLPDAKPLYSQNLWQRIFGGFSLTAAGEGARTMLEQAISEVSQTVSSAPDELGITREILINLGAHALLIDTLNFEQLDVTDPLYARSQHKFDGDHSSGNGCSGGVEYWSSLTGAFDHGGHGGDGHGGDSGGDSGCGGGDSGCGGGCSGCGGGCGGCGS